VYGTRLTAGYYRVINESAEGFLGRLMRRRIPRIL